MVKKPTVKKTTAATPSKSPVAAPPTFLPPPLTPQQYSDHAAKAAGADRLIMRLSSHADRVKSMDYLRTLGDFASYVPGTNPAMEMQGVRELLSHLGAETAPPGLVEELQLEISAVEKTA